MAKMAEQDAERFEYPEDTELCHICYQPIITCDTLYECSGEIRRKAEKLS